jgi:DNA-binding response OmpR family regulator
MMTTTPEPDLQNVKLLIVDDEPDLVDLLSFELERQGYRVATSTSGVEARELIRHQYFDLLITDLKMLGCSGIELCRAVRAKGDNTAIIVISGFSDVGDQLAQLQVFAVMKKPFSIQDLGLSIKAALAPREGRNIGAAFPGG